MYLNTYRIYRKESQHTLRINRHKIQILSRVPIPSNSKHLAITRRVASHKITRLLVSSAFNTWHCVTKSLNFTQISYRKLHNRLGRRSATMPDTTSGNLVSSNPSDFSDGCSSCIIDDALDIRSASDRPFSSSALRKIDASRA